MMEHVNIATANGSFKPIPFLRDRTDWVSWYDSIVSISTAQQIWVYVDPTTSDELVKPQEPVVPIRPRLGAFPARKEYESDRVFELRVEQERHDQLLVLREYDIQYEKYRMEAARYLEQLKAYNTTAAHVQQLLVTMHKTICDRYKAYLGLDGATTPRAVIQCLKARIQPSPERDLASAALRAFNSNVSDTGPVADKNAFIEAVALATVNLHRFKGSRFDEGTAVKELVRALQRLDATFAESLQRKSTGKVAASVLEIVEDFKCRLREEEDTRPNKNVNRELDRSVPSSNGDAPLSARIDRDCSTPSDETIAVDAGRATSYFSPDNTSTSSNILKSRHVGNGNGNGNAASPANGLAKAPPSERILRPDRDLQRHPSSLGDEIYRAPKEGTHGTSRPTSVISHRSRRVDHGDVASHANGLATGAPSERKPRPGRDLQRPASPPEDETHPAPWGDDKSSRDAPCAHAKDPASRPGESPRIVKRTCPGCALRHAIRGDAWWESCFVYYDMNGLADEIPSHFKVRDRELELAYTRLNDFAEERWRADDWAKARAARRMKKGAKGSWNADKADKARGRSVLEVMDLAKPIEWNN